MGDPEVPSEEKEKWNLDREKVEDLYESSRHVERVIGAQDGEEETEYLVKCTICVFRCFLSSANTLNRESTAL